MIDTTLRDWRAEFVPVVGDDVSRTPGTYTLHYRLTAEPVLCRILRLVGLEPIVLTFERKLSRRQGRRVVERHWLPGYMFLAFDAAVDRWQQVRRMPGAIRFLADDGKPLPISEEDFYDLRARCPAVPPANDAETVIPCGSEVEILDGPFRGQTGMVSRSRGRSCWAELIVFNRPTSVELATKAVRIIR